jgi:hypothetical protein
MLKALTSPGGLWILQKVSNATYNNPNRPDEIEPKFIVVDLAGFNISRYEIRAY